MITWRCSGRISGLYYIKYLLIRVLSKDLLEFPQGGKCLGVEVVLHKIFER